MNDIANKIIKDNLDKTEEIYQLELQIEALKTENLKLAEQLENAVVLSCNVGDTVYIVYTKE